MGLLDPTRMIHFAPSSLRVEQKHVFVHACNMCMKTIQNSEKQISMSSVYSRAVWVGDLWSHQVCCHQTMIVSPTSQQTNAVSIKLPSMGEAFRSFGFCWDVHGLALELVWFTQLVGLQRCHKTPRQPLAVQNSMERMVLPNRGGNEGRNTWLLRASFGQAKQ